MERKIIVDHLTISYKGLFSVREVYRLIDFWFMEKGYTKHELNNYEEVNPDGKSIYVQKEPYKKISDYIKYVVRIEIQCDKVKEVDVEKDNKTVRLNQGDCTVMITGYFITDYDQRWTANPVFYFMRSLFDKYVWRVHVNKGEGGLVEECNHLADQIRSFLNLYRY